MAIIQADIIDIKTDTPQQSDIFFVDTNVWFWQTYRNAGFGANSYQLSNYPNYPYYINLALSNGATLTYSGLTLAELAHIIEKTEYDIYVQSNGYLHFKKYRHDYPKERANVVAEVQFTWRRIKKIAIPIDLYSKRLELGLFYNITNRLKASPRCGERFGEGFHIWLNYEPFAV